MISQYNYNYTETAKVISESFRNFQYDHKQAHGKDCAVWLKKGLSMYDEIRGYLTKDDWLFYISHVDKLVGFHHYSQCNTYIIAISIEGYYVPLSSLPGLINLLRKTYYDDNQCGREFVGTW